MVHFCNIFVFQNLLKDEVVLKIPFFCETVEKERPVPALTIPFFFFISWTSSYNSFSFFTSWTSSYNSFSFLFPEPTLTIAFPFLFPEPTLTIPFPFLFPEPTLTIPLPVNKFPNKLAPKVPKTYLKIFIFTFYCFLYQLHHFHPQQ